jgi:branched-chain amino acid transport system substrate-binding protein
VATTVTEPFTDNECPTGRALIEPGASAATNAGAEADLSLQAAGDGVLDFGSLFPTSGVLSPLATPMYAGLEVALAEINAAGGVFGNSVTSSHGDAGDIFDDTAVNEANRLLDGGVDAIIGPLTATSTREVLGPVTEAGAILVNSSSAAASLAELPDSGRFFRTQPVDEFRARALAQVVLLDGHRTVVLSALDGDTFSASLSEWFTDEFTQGGGQVLSATSHSEEPEVDNLIDEVGAGEPDALVLIGFDEVATILDALVAAGLGPDIRATYASDAAFGSWLSNAVLEPWSIRCMVGLVAPEVATLEFGDRLLEVNPDLGDTTFAAETYDAAIVVALAAVVADADDPVLIAEHVNDVTRVGTKCFSFSECRELVDNGVDIDFDGQSGPLEFDDNGEPTVAVTGVGELDANGQVRVLTNHVYVS